MKTEKYQECIVGSEQQSCLSGTAVFILFPFITPQRPRRDPRRDVKNVVADVFDGGDSVEVLVADFGGECLYFETKVFIF